MLQNQQAPVDLCVQSQELSSATALEPCVKLSCLQTGLHIHGPCKFELPGAPEAGSVQAPNYLCYTYNKPKKVSREEGKRYSGQCQKWCVLHHLAETPHLSRSPGRSATDAVVAPVRPGVFWQQPRACWLRPVA